ncbi:hypothetical protein KIL84_001466 [Mauremys mutica]|uniref:Uncharacterized protein n=1 Tax=Mauremys mutica TaxID=74926 RepID=A0A9D3WZ76_9SAUR|nr:hypothetical protein KIL84_001466 [Mauremys mutica]
MFFFCIKHVEVNKLTESEIWSLHAAICKEQSWQGIGWKKEWRFEAPQSNPVENKQLRGKAPLKAALWLLPPHMSTTSHSSTGGPVVALPLVYCPRWALLP